MALTRVLESRVALPKLSGGGNVKKPLKICKFPRFTLCVAGLVKMIFEREDHVLMSDNF